MKLYLLKIDNKKEKKEKFWHLTHGKCMGFTQPQPFVALVG